MNTLTSNYGIGVGAPSWVHAYGLQLLLLVIWSLFWKGLGLWHAGRKAHPWWFVIIFLVNTAGILEIIYLFAILKLKFSQLFEK